MTVSVAALATAAMSRMSATAIARAFPGNTINFDETLSGQTIVLREGQLTIDEDLKIEGPGALLT